MHAATCNPSGYRHVPRTPSYGIPVINGVPTTEILQRLMTDRGWTQRDLADRIHVDQKTVSRWMTGATNLSERRLRGVFATLAIDPAVYGVEPLTVAPPAIPGDVAEVLEAVQDVLVRVSDVPLLMARMELVAADVRAIREHLDIPQPQETRA